MPPLLILPVRIPVPAAPSFPIITTAALPDATVGVAYSLQLAASSGVPPYTWAIASALPNTGSWLFVSSSGLLTGTPGTAELELLTVQVLDANGRVGSSPFRLLVAGGGGGGGQLVHNQLFTITGSGFGTKSRALAPILRDVGAAPVNTLDSQWSGGNPNAATTNANFNLQNQTAGFSPTGAAIGRPHPYVPRILAGCSGDHTNGSNTNQNIGAWVNYDRPSAGADYVLYCSLYYRADPNWTFEIGSPNDNNFKTYAVNGSHSGPYDGSNQYGYLNFATGSGYNNTPTTKQLVTDAPHDTTAGFANPDANGHNVFWSQSLWPFHAANGWIKQEIEMYMTSSTTLGGGGRIDVFENANRTSKCAYRGYTDKMPGTARSWLVGGYNRDYGASAANNYRYFSDIYVDTAYSAAPGGHVARVMVGDNPVYANCTVCEPSIPTAWADGSITFIFGKAGLIGGTTGYIFVQPEAGAVISAGSALIAVSP